MVIKGREEIQFAFAKKPYVVFNSSNIHYIGNTSI